MSFYVLFHSLKRATVTRAWAIVGHSSLVRYRGVALVLSQAVLWVLLMQRHAHPISMHFRKYLS